MLKVPSRQKPLGRVTDRVAGGFAVTCGILALGTASATSASAQASPDDHPTCPNCVIQFDLVTNVGSLDGPGWMRRLPSEDGFPAPSANIYGISEADGRLWIVGQHPVEDWTLYWNREINRELEAREIDEAKLYRSVVEVVETETGRLVSSASVPGLVVTLLPDQHVATYREDEAGVPFLDVFRMTVSRPGGGLAIEPLRDKLFNGSGELLMTQLVADEPLSPAAVRRLRKQLDERLKKEEER